MNVCLYIHTKTGDNYVFIPHKYDRIVSKPIAVHLSIWMPLSYDNAGLLLSGNASCEVVTEPDSPKAYRPSYSNRYMGIVTYVNDCSSTYTRRHISNKLQSYIQIVRMFVCFFVFFSESKHFKMYLFSTYIFLFS